MLLRFTKMHGLGNDFMVVDLISQNCRIEPDIVRLWSDRHLGIGFDQLLLVDPPSQPDIDFGYRIFNADGSEVEQCGNGARCFARFVLDKRLTLKKKFKVETKSGVIGLEVLADGSVRVNMGAPIFEPVQIPFKAPRRAQVYELLVEGNNHSLYVLSMGNPHAVKIVENVAEVEVSTLGAAIESDPMFPAKVNVGFMQLLNHHQIKLRVWERGVGETRACGTGACAAVVSGIQAGFLNSPVKVQLLGGELSIHWSGYESDSVQMTGSATRVFEGQIRV